MYIIFNFGLSSVLLFQNLKRLKTKLTCFGVLQWVVQGAVSVDIGANPSAEGGEDDESVDDQAVKVVDIVDTFRLQVHKFFCY